MDSSVISIVVGLVVTLIIGFLRIRARRRTLVKDAEFAIEFQEKLAELLMGVKTRQVKDETYSWLVRNMDRMQGDLMHFGVANRREPFQNYIINNYPYIINTVPQIIRGDAHQIDVQMCFDAIVRYLGFLERLDEKIGTQFLNPFVWLREGVRFWITLPFKILEWIGLIDSRFANRAINSNLVGIISGIVTLFGLISSLITIVLGWEQFLNFIKGVFK